MVERELQLFEEKQPTATIEGDISISLDSPHVLFDVPLEETLREFIDLLDEYYDPGRVYKQLRTTEQRPERHPMFVFESAIGELLALPGHEGFAWLATENTASAAHELGSWERLAALWLWQYLSAYNRHLREAAPGALENLKRVVTDLQRSEQLAATDVQTLVGYYSRTDHTPVDSQSASSFDSTK